MRSFRPLSVATGPRRGASVRTAPSTTVPASTAVERYMPARNATKASRRARSVRVSRPSVARSWSNEAYSSGDAPLHSGRVELYGYGREMRGVEDKGFPLLGIRWCRSSMPPAPGRLARRSHRFGRRSLRTSRKRRPTRRFHQRQAVPQPQSRRLVVPRIERTPRRRATVRRCDGVRHRQSCGGCSASVDVDLA